MVTMLAGIEPRESVAQERGGVGVFQARDEQWCRREAARCKRSIQGVDCRGVGGQKRCAIEDNRHDRLFGRQRSQRTIEIDRAFPGQIAGDARHRCGFTCRQLVTGMAGEPAQQGAQIFAAAFAEVAEQNVQLRRRQRRGGGEAVVVAVFAGEDGELNAAFARDGGEALDAIFPPVEAAEQPDHDDLGMGADPSIHRSTDIGWRRSRRCARRTRGSAVRSACPRGGETGEVAVGQRKNAQCRPALTEIDRFDDVVERGRTGRDSKWRLQRASLAKP